MNSYERVKRAICFESPDRVPVWYINTDQREGDVLWYDLRLYKDQDEIEGTGGWHKGHESEWGYTWRTNADGTMGQPEKPVIETAEDINNYKLPDVNEIGRFRGADQFLKESDGYYRLAMLIVNGFTTYTFLRGFENTMIDFAERNPDALNLLRRIFEFEKELIWQCKAHGLHGFHLGDDWGTQKSLIISPVMWDEIFAPLYKDQIEYAHDLGMDVWFHSCGNFTEITERLHLLGVDVINIAQPNVVDIEAVGKSLKGRQCFLIPLSYQTTSISGSEEEIHSEAKRMYNALSAEKGGFIGYVEEYYCMGMSSDNLEACKQAFKRLSDSKNIDGISEKLSTPGGNIVIGVDGNTDEVWQVIESRTSLEEFILYEKMVDFGRTLVDCGMGGISYDTLPKRSAYGGFTANTGKAVSRLGVRPKLIGFFGKDSIHPLFSEFGSIADLTTVGDPGACQIYEFPDGKLMLAHIQEVMLSNWERLTAVVPEEKLKSMFEEADVIAIGYWCVLHSFDEIIENICRLVRDGGKKHRMFFDPADIRTRDKAALIRSLKVLASLNSQIPMTLSLNEHEATILFSYFGETFIYDDFDSGKQTERVRCAIGIDELIVHTPKLAVAASASEGCCIIRQKYCESPVITTGAGDNFNGGYLVALLKGLDLAERLAVASANTYLYISRGYSPDMDELLEELSVQP